MKNMMDELNFDEIEIEISYGKDQEYEVEIERHSNDDIDAEIEDELNGEDINDDLEAFNKLYPKVKQLDIEQDTDKEEVIKQVDLELPESIRFIKAFNKRFNTSYPLIKQSSEQIANLITETLEQAK